VKLTKPLERVLRAFLTDPDQPRYGYDLMQAARLPSGTLYPMLARLQDEGLVTSQWESRGHGSEDSSGRPPRKYYQLTGEGVRVARLELAQAASRQTPAAARRAVQRSARPSPGSAQ
jgi:PadR family transcriptional regulator, regulatory protein PadR